MAKSFLFYDLETSGLSPASDRIMQFAAQRTDLDLNPLGEPINVLVKLNDDTLPSPDAIMVTGITPQKTSEEGYSEAEFSKYLISEVFTADTIVVGFNNVRFDDEFIRYLFWRNFHDPYEWFWKDGRSRWDMLDVVRMTRALRPEGIDWPNDDKGEPTNRLELITKVNNIDHQGAHDALSDVRALIDVARLIKTKQPQLFEYLLKMRSKSEVQALVNLDEKKPVVYTSGRYDNQFAKTTVSLPIAPGPNGSVVVYDLRYSPDDFFDLSVEDMTKILFATWAERQAEDFAALPVKLLYYNRCPAVAPLGVLAQNDGWQKIGLTKEEIEQNIEAIIKRPEFAEKIRTVYEQPRDFPRLPDPESKLYDSFLNDRDRLRVEAVRNAGSHELADFHPEFQDERLPELLLHYKARSYPMTLSEQEMVAWEEWRAKRLMKDLPKYQERIIQLMQTADDDQRFLLEELQLWAEAIVPID